MMDFATLVEKHAGMKQCKPTDEEGCGRLKPLSEYHYKWRQKTNGKRKQYDNWCKVCRRARDRIARKKIEAQEEGRYMKTVNVEHTGPLDCPGVLFFCVIPPTTVEDRTNRYNVNRL